MSSDRFPNKAGDHADTDAILSAELTAAGIEVFQRDFFRDTSGEVKTSVLGILHSWKFTRAWYYWMCEGPGIDPVTAERLHATHGRVVRVAGHCGCPSPLEWFKGFAVGSYHVDTPAGLKALADTLKEIAGRSAAPPTAAAQGDDARDGGASEKYIESATVLGALVGILKLLRPVVDEVGWVDTGQLESARDIVEAITGERP